MAAREASFGAAISALLDGGERPEYETTAIGGPKQKINAYATMLANYGNKGRRALIQLVDAGNSKDTLGDAIVSS